MWQRGFRDVHLQSVASGRPKIVLAEDASYAQVDGDAKASNECRRSIQSSLPDFTSTFSAPSSLYHYRVWNTE